MQTSLVEIEFKDGRIYRIFCRGKNQIKRFNQKKEQLKDEVKTTRVISNGIHLISEFEKL